MIGPVEEVMWLNGAIVRHGETATSSVASLSFHTGTAVIDGILAIRRDSDYRVHLGLQHYARFLESCRAMDLDVTWLEHELLAATNELLASAPRSSAYYVRPVAWRAASSFAFSIASSDREASLAILIAPISLDGIRAATPLSCVVSDVRRVSKDAMPVQHKVTGMYANSYICTRRALRRGFASAIMLDQNDCVCEAPVANLFFVFRDGRLATPSLDLAVYPGLTRQVVIAAARSLGHTVDEILISRDDLFAVDAAFMCSTMLGVRPISAIEDVALKSSTAEIVGTIIRSVLVEMEVAQAVD